VNPLDWIQYEFLGNSLLIWGLGAGLFVVAWAALLFARRLLRGRLRALASRRRDVTAFVVAEQVVAETKAWFLLAVAVYVGSRAWVLEESVDVGIVRAAMVAFLLQAGLWVAAAALKLLSERRERELRDNPDAVAAMDVLSFVVRAAIWSLVLLVIFDNLGVDITTLVAGLGVGGIAVALAAQSLIGDLFASLSIVLDKPFVVGDFLSIGEFLGNVEKVGIKTTRLRSLSGEQLVFSNNDLLSSRIRNFGRMFQRRVLFTLGVTYQTSAEQLRRISEIIREAITAQQNVRFDRAHFQSYGDFALVFEAVYYVLSPDYNKYMDTQQAINLRIFEEFEREGIEFAYPTQTLYVNRVDAIKT
jgi:small-conductance mechanosensitive channel